jgi:hypothetical protein
MAQSVGSPTAELSNSKDCAKALTLASINLFSSLGMLYKRTKAKDFKESPP